MKPRPARSGTWFKKAGQACRHAAAASAETLSGLSFHGRTLVGRLWNHLLARPASRRSLRLRLSLFFSLFMLAAWLAAALFTWHTCRSYINEFFDSQQMVVAKTLAVADLSHAPKKLPKLGEMMPGVKKRGFGQQEDDAIAFAVFSPDGRRLLADGKKGGRFPFEPSRRGFIDEPLRNDDDVWRILWMNSRDGNHVIAVGQELEYRSDMALEMLGGQMLPWLILLPVLLGGLFLLLTRELAPLRSMAADLQSREPEDDTPLNLQKLPSEVMPMAQSLNGFFSRTGELLTRERSFISDAAHELRTPLAGLRIQAQVAAQSGMPSETRNEALAFLRQGIDRCSRLIDQLLALSRLEASQSSGRTASPEGLSLSMVSWNELLAQALPSYSPRLEQANIRLESRISSLSASVEGNPALLAMLLRNLLENATAYTTEGGLIRVTLEQRRLTVQNDCACLPEESVRRLGERFFRPPGQEKTGSGLGISIVRRIVAIHGFHLSLGMEKNDPDFSECSFKVTLSW